MNFWRLITHHKKEKREQALAWSRQNGRIAIGWGLIGDICDQAFRSPKEISSAIRQHYLKLNNSGQGGRSLWNFYFELQKGDLVLLRAKKQELIFEVQGAYNWKPTEPALGDYLHQRDAQVSDVTPEEFRRMAGTHPESGQNIYWTLIRYGRTM